MTGGRASQLSVGGFELYGMLMAHNGFEGKAPYADLRTIGYTRPRKAMIPKAVEKKTEK